MKVELRQGESVSITLEGTDGLFKVIYGKETLRVTSDLPDTKGRKGVIYEEAFGKAFKDMKASQPEEGPAALPATKVDRRAQAKAELGVLGVDFKADFHALPMSARSMLVKMGKSIKYRQPKSYSGSYARAFFDSLSKLK